MFGSLKHFGHVLTRSESLHVGVIGSGWIFKNILLHMDRSQVDVHVCHLNEPKIEKPLRPYTHIYADVKDMMCEEGIQAVILANPWADETRYDTLTNIDHAIKTLISLDNDRDLGWKLSQCKSMHPTIDNIAVGHAEALCEMSVTWDPSGIQDTEQAYLVQQIIGCFAKTQLIQYNY